MIKNPDEYKTCQNSVPILGAGERKRPKKANNEVLLPHGTGLSEEFTAAG